MAHHRNDPLYLPVMTYHLLQAEVRSLPVWQLVRNDVATTVRWSVDRALMDLATDEIVIGMCNPPLDRGSVSACHRRCPYEQKPNSIRTSTASPPLHLYMRWRSTRRNALPYATSPIRYTSLKRSSSCAKRRRMPWFLSATKTALKHWRMRWNLSAALRRFTK